jgi:hypothetical protein
MPAPVAYVPAAQPVQTVREVAKPNVPAPHASHLEAWAYPDPVPYLPTAHPVHVAWGVTLYVPARHRVQVAEVVAPSSALKVPALQLMHASACDTRATPVPYVPMGQVRHIPTPVAAACVVYVPATQAEHLSDATAPEDVLYRPATQEEHSVWDWKPEPVPYVPAAHFSHGAPGFAELYVPARQAVQVVCITERSATVPVAHTVGAVAPACEQ